MVQCFVAECDHSYSKSQCSFFRLPSDIKARRTWEKLCGRPQDCSNENSRICSCHFIGGVKAAGPSLFSMKQERVSYLQASDNGVKEELEEKDIVSPQGGPGRPTNNSSMLMATSDTPEVDEAVEETTVNFKEEEESESKLYIKSADCISGPISLGNLRDC